MRSGVSNLVAAGLLLAGCQLSFVSHYDATTDQGVTALAAIETAPGSANSPS